MGFAKQYPREQLLNVSTNYASFLQRFGKTSALQERKRVLDDEILTLIANGVRGFAMAGEWFELYGDRLEDHAEAANLYGFGVRGVPNYFANRVKFVGASLLSGTNRDDLRRDLKVCDPAYLKKLVDWMEAQKYPNNINPLKTNWAWKRWKAGSGFLSNNFGTPRVSSLPPRLSTTV